MEIDIGSRACVCRTMYVIAPSMSRKHVKIVVTLSLGLGTTAYVILRLSYRCRSWPAKRHAFDERDDNNGDPVPSSNRQDGRPS